MWRMTSSVGKTCLLLALSVFGDSNPTIISPGGALKATRDVISFAEHQTIEDRHAHLQRTQEQGYTCWMLPAMYRAATCIQNPSSLYTDLPENAEALRLTLAKVNLRDWLPSILCPSPAGNGEEAATGSMTIDHTRCREVVEASLVTQPQVEIIQTASREGRQLTARVSIDDTPWLQAMQGMSKWDVATISRHCSAVSMGLAAQRAKMQLLPALTILAGRKQALSSTEKNGAGSDDTAHASSASATPIIPITSRLAEPSAERIESLLSLLEGANGHSNERMVPSLRMVFPQPGGRLSGGVVPFSGEITLGAALTASLDAANAKTVHTRDTHPIPAEHRQLRNDIGSSSSPGSGGHKHAVLASSDIDACVVRVIVDDVLVSTVPIDAAKSADDTGSSDAEATLAIQTAVQPTYESNARCSEHPAKEAVAAPTEGRGAWPDNEVNWRLEARSVEKICTREVFGPHRIHGELACRRIVDDENVAGTKATVEAPSAKTSPEATREPPPRPEPERTLEGSRWEVMATSAVVEYFHTGNLVDVLSSSPWTVDAESKHDDARREKGEHERDTSPLFDPPPEDISVSLYVDSDPENTDFVVTVPRWLSDGEVWEVAYNTCFKTFGPSQGFTVNTNDCVDLVTSAIAAKRVDLYYIMSARLMAYLDSINPDFSILGNTGANPEKVEALGAIARQGGLRLSTICEVGFNAGHSSLNWLLSSHPSTNILAFDVGEYDYMNHALDFLEAVFPGRLKVVVGDSAVTVPAYATVEKMADRDPRVCGVVFVDGDHSEEGAYADIVNLQALASRNWNVLAIDDFEGATVQAGWKRYREDGPGIVEQVVAATGGYFAHVLESKGGVSHMRVDDEMHNYFKGYGHYSLGVGTYVIS